MIFSQKSRQNESYNLCTQGSCPGLCAVAPPTLIPGSNYNFIYNLFSVWYFYVYLPYLVSNKKRANRFRTILTVLRNEPWKGDSTEGRA